MSKMVFIAALVSIDGDVVEFQQASTLARAESLCEERAAKHVGTVWQVFAPIASFTAAAPVVTRTEVELPKPAEPIPPEEEFEQRRWKAPEAAKADAEGWIEWKGGLCPVSAHSPVEVRLRSGELAVDRAKQFDWSHNEWPSDAADIIAYRIIGERS